MSQELLAIIEQIEREKGIKKEVLIEAVESALLSAAKRVIDLKPDEEFKVELDRNSGKIRAYRNEEEVTSIDFGRIAASTARQVIIQKMREAEKDVIFNEFQGRVGEIVSGTVYRFEKGNIVIDLLGKAEGILVKREQSPKEEFKQGQRIRALLLDVKKESRGAQIILSRTHPNLVKKLFELEVPEIYEGIVEVKSISRQAGERTKISVYSKNDKVDSVGACVGMRGNRVRNIVNELYGEKIDIVRFNEDIREYIKNALSPAKVSEIKLDKEKLKAEVIVEDDQLSLSIGKHGQNVRLASRLIGWELDIRTKAAKEQDQEKEKAEKALSLGQEESAVVEKTKKKTKKSKKPLASLEDLPGLGEKTIVALKDAGINSLAELIGAEQEGLMKIKGIGEKKAAKLIADAKKLK
ncbi:MAG: transcription termination factor NusA [Candidatus Omnitrophica bacterium]|jgi:N utilization substance protein A|nr:transcription termination factor NusA [Candidatus Omnitrophota bacterium]MDD4981284.1 transcription termination factor NusA [Candidatus Omnitrophota bacterium]MDD5664571.1 transcription termination factor NusA [Candidatus Omnitrophota bacterium]